MTRHEATPNSAPILTLGRLGRAGLAAALGCAACCAVPLLPALGLSGAAAATIGGILKPGAELVVGSLAGAAALGVIVVWLIRLTLRRGCGPSCRVDGQCCGARSTIGRAP